MKTATAKIKPTRPTFITVDDSEVGSHLLAYFRATRAHIMQAFGPPNAKTFDKSKTSSEWNLKTPKGELVSIYDDRDDFSDRAWRQRKQIEMLWHIGGVQPSAAEEIGEALGVPLRNLQIYRKPEPPKPSEPPKGTREHEAATRRLVEIVEPDGFATGIFKLPVGDRNPVTVGVNEDDYRRVIATPFKGSVEVFERPSGHPRLLRWDYGNGAVALIFVDGEDDLTGKMYPILWEGVYGAAPVTK